MQLIATTTLVGSYGQARAGDPLPGLDDEAARSLVARGLARPVPAQVATPGPAAPPFAGWPDWRGRTCVVVGSGPSAAAAPLELARGRAAVLAVNESWRLAPWADALYGCDRAWWQHRAGVPDFAGLKVTADKTAAQRFGLQLVTLRVGRHELLTDHPGVLGWFGNSGGQAVNLAVQFGPPARLILVGFDLCLAADGEVHWHGRHPARLNNPRAAVLEAWAERLDRQACRLAELGVEVINASPTSALKAYPKATLQEALGA